ncbi:hypothetical protein PLICRDRAFT_176923 [Plicaturopsis crispa FD-325 SS-3]|nr:hypothetical protein PLICRDRAFT_176923 [Plicaturopsis crispa FD-325 SS-3]
MTDASSDKSRITIAIVGGGIGGLLAAIGLGRIGYDVHVFEQASQFSEIGAGIAFGPNAVEVFRLLGVINTYERVADMGYPNKRWFEFVNWSDGKLISDVRCKGTDSTVHRARFLESLVPLLPSTVKTHFSAHVTHVENVDSSTVRLTISDSRTERDPDRAPARTFDAHVAIGADGVKSRVRDSIESGRVRWTGTYAYRGLIPVEDVVRLCGESGRESRMWLGLGKHVLAFPVERGTIINVVAFVSDRSAPPDERNWDGPWTVPVSPSDVLADYEGWETRCRDILSLIDKPSKWALHELVPLEHWTEGRITLLGDSAHASLPHNGAGAGQATEDVYVLCSLLAHPACTVDTIPRFLQAYENVRRARAARQQIHSRESGEVYEFVGPDGENLSALGAHLKERYEWIWEHNVQEDIDSAFASLRAEGLVD